MDLREYKKRWKGRIWERRNRERQRDRSNLEGALAPPPPWRPWNRGGPLLQSREESKEEEEGGGSLPLSPGGAGTPPGKSSCDSDLRQHLHHLPQHLHHLPSSIFSGPLSRNPLYPLVEHGFLCFILLSNDVLPSYDVWVDFRCPIGGWWIAMIDLICLWLCCCPLVPIIWLCAWITP